MSRVSGRATGEARLDPDIREEVKHDGGAMGQAIVMVGAAGTAVG